VQNAAHMNRNAFARHLLKKIMAADIMHINEWEGGKRENRQDSWVEYPVWM
jgi:hypothetical protein